MFKEPSFLIYFLAICFLIFGLMFCISLVFGRRVADSIVAHFLIKLIELPFVLIAKLTKWLIKCYFSLSGKRLLLIGFLISILFYISCAPPKIRTISLIPPRVSEMANIRKIAILEFKNDRRNRIRSLLEANLASHRVKGSPYFIVADRINIDKVIREIDFQITYGDEKQAADIGKMLGVEAIITGSVISESVSDQYYQERRIRCLDKKCKQKQEYSVSCCKRTAFFSFCPSIVKVETAQIIFSNTFEGYSEDRVCQDSGRPLLSKDILLSEARKKAIYKFIKNIAPYEVPVTIAIFTKYKGTDKETTKQINSLLKQAKTWINANRIKRACIYIKQAYQFDPQSYLLNYNMGVCEEINGRLQKALDFYKKADYLSPKPVKEIIKAILRVKRCLRAQKLIETNKRIR